MFQHTLLSSRANTGSSHYYSLQVFAIALSLISLLLLLSHFSSSCQKDDINAEIRSSDFPTHNVPIASKKPTPCNSLERVPHTWVWSHPWYLVSFSLLNLLKYSDIYTQSSIISEALNPTLRYPSVTLSLTHTFSQTSHTPPEFSAYPT